MHQAPLRRYLLRRLCLLSGQIEVHRAGNTAETATVLLAAQIAHRTTEGN